MITQYDVFGRVTQTGWINASVTDTSRSEAQTTINNGSTPFELSDNQVLTKNYYDNYAFMGAPNPLPAPVEDQQLALNVKGLQTGSWVRVLDNASSSTAELSYTLYDYKYRPVHTKTTNHLGGYTQVDTHLDWAGKTLYTLTKHKRTADDTELVVKDMFEYTPQDRLALHKQQINDLPEQPEQLITKNTYDELGQLISKNVGGAYAVSATGLQTVDYAYNIRGWLKTINNVDRMANDLIAFKINYNEAETATPLFNGNIAETFWKSNTDNIKRKYKYKYDDLNRLLQADYSKEGNTIFNSYLEHISYDKNGNIQTLLRNGDMDTDGMQFENPIDNLTYLYDDTNKNQLLRVFDATASPIGFKDDTNGVDINQEIYETPDYGYDANGNMTRDDNKGITSITYNHLNLPVIIYFAGDNKITYLYNATGQKMSKTVLQTGAITTTDYISGFQYKNTILQFFPHTEGYVNATEEMVFMGGTSYRFNYVFNYTDHLGNIRLSYSQDPSTNVLKVIEENHYYPFGLKHTGYNSDQLMYVKEASVLRIKPKPPLFKTSYDKKFNGKSWETDLSLNVYDFHARGYMPDIVRTFQQDPKSEEMRRWSPYSFFFDNPMRFVDPDGMKPVDWYLNKFTGNVTWKEGTGSKFGYVNLGHHWGHSDARGNRFQMDGDTKQITYNGKVLYDYNKDKSGSYGGFAFADGGNNQNPSELRKGGRDAQMIDFNGALEWITTLLSIEPKGSTAKGKGTNGGKPTVDDKIDDAVNTIDKASSATGEAATAREIAKKAEEQAVKKDSIRTTWYNKSGKEIRTEIRAKKDEEK
jgi:RHS repeat-associated protein